MDNLFKNIKPIFVYRMHASNNSNFFLISALKTPYFAGSFCPVLSLIRDDMCRLRARCSLEFAPNLGCCALTRLISDQPAAGCGVSAATWRLPWSVAPVNFAHDRDQRLRALFG